jgi:hypothetical protein
LGRGTSIALAGIAMVACGPEAAADFVGDYDMTLGGWGCVIEHPEAASHLVSGYFGPRSIEENADGTLVLDLPMPPCPLTGSVDGERLHLDAEDCVIDYEASSQIEAYSVQYGDGFGVGEWHEGILEITTETRRRHTSIPDGLPDWWDEPGSCSARFSLEPG